MILIAKDIVKDEPLIVAAQWRENADGTVSAQMPDGRFASQQEDGTFHFDATVVGPWERAKLSGQIAVWSNKGRYFVYSWAETPA